MGLGGEGQGQRRGTRLERGGIKRAVGKPKLGSGRRGQGCEGALGRGHGYRHGDKRVGLQECRGGGAVCSPEGCGLGASWARRRHMQPVWGLTQPRRGAAGRGELQ